MKDRVKMEDDSKAKIQIDAEQHPEQKKAGSVFSVIAEAFYITKLNLCLYFGGIAIIAQVYLGWDHFWYALRYADKVEKTAPLYLILPFTLGFQIIVLVFIKHYSNRLNQIETRQAIKES